jgi:hypothetical protein
MCLMCAWIRVAIRMRRMLAPFVVATSFSAAAAPLANALFNRACALDAGGIAAASEVAFTGARNCDARQVVILAQSCQCLRGPTVRLEFLATGPAHESLLSSKG